MVILFTGELFTQVYYCVFISKFLFSFRTFRY